LVVAKEFAAHRGVAIDFRQANAEHLDFPDASFDAVYSFGVLHHTPGTEQALAEVLRVLRPGGTAIIGLYHRDSWFFWLSTLLGAGIIRLGLFRKGWRRLLSEIEYRSAANSAVPLVKVYSRAQVRRLFRGFAQVRVSSHHVEATHFLPPLSHLLRPVPRARLERRLGFGGWYLVIRATKAAV